MGMKVIDGHVLPDPGLDGSGRSVPSGAAGKFLPSTRAMTKTYPSITFIPITAARPMRTSTTHSPLSYAGRKT